MDEAVDVGAEIRLYPADLPLVLQEHLEVLADRQEAGASRDELAALVAELRQSQGW